MADLLGEQSRPRPPRRRRVAVALGMLGAFFVLLAINLSLPDKAPETPPAAVPWQATTPQSATIPEIAANLPTAPTLFRLQEDPVILVLDFPSLHPQAQMLNRVAALTEKAGLPHDRVLTEPELNAKIKAAGTTPDRFYYGHDYSAAELARFFDLAARQGLALTAEEAWLRDTIDKEGWLQPGATGALITIPAPSADIDPAARTAIFRHELSHGAYFTDPAYVALTHRWWTTMLSEPERAAFRAFLAKQGYDTTDETLMENEAQAYYVHTRDKRYFYPAVVGIGPARDAILRGTFIEAIPEPWLRDSALAVAPVSGEPSSAPARPPPPIPPVDEVLTSPRPPPQ